MGFGVPLGLWMRRELHDFSHDLLLGPGARIGDLLDRTAIQTYLSQHERELQDHGQKIWALLCLELWLRKMQDATPAPPKSTGVEPLAVKKEAN
jgi:asparagine synthase (glutamine-hydrolysing)